MTIENVFEKLVEHYKEASLITAPYRAHNIFRRRQYSISSISEDLFAYFLQQHFSTIYEFPIYFMVDYPMVPVAGSKMFPDIAIIIEEKEPVLASYIDLKTDLGYKRDYFNQYPAIVEKITQLRKAGFTGTRTIEEVPVKVLPQLKWRTVVLSKKNSDGKNFDEILKAAFAISNQFEIYFLADKQHPNEKYFDSSNIYKDAVEKLLIDITNDIEQARAITGERKVNMPF
jgi:hypothetical protein